MFALGMLSVLACLVGSGIAIGYALGHSHGTAEEKSREWDRKARQDRRQKRCTPEPVRLQLVDRRHPCFFDQDGPQSA